MTETATFFEHFAESVGLSSYAISVLKIIGADIILAGDNAVVIALACRSLPPRQRRLGVMLGAGAAVALRIMFTIVVGSLLGVPYLSLVGGVVLFWIAVKLLTAEEAGDHSIAGGTTLWEAIKTVAIADAVMSIDNVLAIAAAAKGDWSLIIFGLVVSIPLVVWGSTVIMSMLQRFPILVWAGGALLGWIAGELIAHEQVVRDDVAAVAGTLGVSAHTLELAAAVTGALIVISASLLIQRAKQPTETG